MAGFNFETCEIENLIVVEPNVIGDDRGYFLETYHYEQFAAGGIKDTFVQDNQSKSSRGVLRGLHFQKQYPQAKLVRVIQGEIFDVGVDLRQGSKTFGQWKGVILSADNKKQLYVPEGFAHGFLVLSETAEIVYKCSDFYHHEDEGGIKWNDKSIGIEWPIAENDLILLSERDKNHPSFEEFKVSLQ